MIKKLMMLFAGTMFAGLASAAPIIDIVEQEEHVGWLESYYYEHDVNDDGFVHGTATSGSIEIEIYDDRDGWLEGVVPEVILIVVDAFDFDTGGVTFGSFSNELEVEALATVNATGLLGVTVRSILGDFYVGNSTLTLAVPAPGALVLLGLGLLGLGFIRRTKAA